jgi:sortase A
MTKKVKKKQPQKELSGAKVRFRFKRHILPPLGGLLVFVLVFGFFNAQWISGQIAYLLNEHSHHTASTIVTISKSKPAPAITISKNAPYRIDIPKISVHAPVIYSQHVVDEASFLQALHNGVVHYPNTALPGQPGNIVIFGHSSGLWWAPGNYKFVFTLLDKLTKNDQISLDYNGIRYVYRVTGKRVVLPTDLSVLDTSTGYNLTLLTCTPVGTDYKRLAVEAVQISPGTEPQKTVITKRIVTVDNKLPGPSAGFWQSFKNLLGL